MFSLLLRNLLFTILQPGLVAGLVPYLILRWQGRSLVPEKMGVLEAAALVTGAVGSMIMIACILRFAYEGKGTLSPLDPTKRLVVRGLYRYSRNPMYVGLMMILISEAVFWRSLSLAVYAGVVFIGLNLFITIHEEPRLHREFGKEFTDYRSSVRRWL